ncbi:2Fe-2S iron-sulfur cluster-binding protein [Celeribacter baekdonensis]|nr:2Fe-2S iron-sulfur cluster-binding protein [Celeribacter baekdonensis]
MTIIRAVHKMEEGRSESEALHVTLAETGKIFPVQPHESVLAAALNAGIELAHECKTGFCGSCRVRILEGAIAYAEDPIGLSDQERGCGFALACQARAQTNLVIEAPLMPTDRPEPTDITAQVVSVDQVCGNITRLRLSPVGGMPAFLPGQYVDVVTQSGATRSFSIASAPDEAVIELHIRTIPGGMFTAGIIPALKCGETVALHGPHGLFRLRPDDFRPLVLVATGTGIAPLRAMLAALRADPDCPPVALYWGMREQSELYLADEIATLGAGLEDFTFVPVLSRAAEGWSGRRGYVQDAVIEDLPDLSEHALYLCGSPAMIAAARGRFLEVGASVNHIYVDSFHFAHNL